MSRKPVTIQLDGTSTQKWSCSSKSSSVSEAYIPRICGKINTPSSAVSCWERALFSWWTNTTSFLLLFSLLPSLVSPCHEASLGATAHPWSPGAHLWAEKEKIISPYFDLMGTAHQSSPVPSGCSAYQSLTSQGTCSAWWTERTESPQHTHELCSRSSFLSHSVPSQKQHHKRLKLPASPYKLLQQWDNANNYLKFPYNANTDHRETESGSQLEELHRDPVSPRN